MPLVKQNVMKLEVFILGRQRIEKEGMGEREKRARTEKGSRERTEKGSREGIEIERKETKGN